MELLIKAHSDHKERETSLFNCLDVKGWKSFLVFVLIFGYVFLFEFSNFFVWTIDFQAFTNK